jgi:hypothetical protein
MSDDNFSVYRVCARNTAAESENKIHDDGVAARFGFRGGLVPGVTVYGYMTVPVVERFGLEWIERGRMQVKFLQPFYEGDEVIVRAEMDSTSLRVTASREDGTLCAAGSASSVDHNDADAPEEYPEAPLPAIEDRPEARSENFPTGLRLGALRERLDLTDQSLLRSLDEKLPVYYGPKAVAHPALLLGLANQILVRNFRLGPWIHAASQLRNFSAARNQEEISVRGRVADCFERKGHEFVVIDLLLTGGEGRLIQKVVHTAIYRPRFA